eukprot:2231349-Pyramimonas_sp.AAC.1
MLNQIPASGRPLGGGRRVDDVTEPSSQINIQWLLAEQRYLRRVSCADQPVNNYPAIYEDEEGDFNTHEHRDHSDD